MAAHAKGQQLLSLTDIFQKGTRLYMKAFLIVLVTAALFASFVVITQAGIYALKPFVHDAVFKDGLGLISVVGAAVFGGGLLLYLSCFWIEYFYDRLMGGAASFLLLARGAFNGVIRLMKTAIVFLLILWICLNVYQFGEMVKSYLTIVVLQVLVDLIVYAIIIVFLCMFLSAFAHTVLRRNSWGVIHSFRAFLNNFKEHLIVGTALLSLTVALFFIGQKVLPYLPWADGGHDYFLLFGLFMVVLPVLMSISTVFSVSLWFKRPERYPLRAGYVASIDQANYSLLKRSSFVENRSETPRSRVLELLTADQKWRQFLMAIFLYPVQRVHILLLGLLPVAASVLYGVSLNDLNQYIGGEETVAILKLVLLGVTFLYANYIFQNLGQDAAGAHIGGISLLWDVSFGSFFRHFLVQTLVLGGLAVVFMVVGNGVLQLVLVGAIGFFILPTILPFVEGGFYETQASLAGFLNEALFKILTFVLWSLLFGWMFVTGFDHLVTETSLADFMQNDATERLTGWALYPNDIALMKVILSWSVLSYTAMILSRFAADGPRTHRSRKLDRVLKG